MKYIKPILKTLAFSSVVILALGLNSCDDLGEDQIPLKGLNEAEDLEISISQQSPIVVDLLEHTGISETASVSISEIPQKGTAELITSSALLKYLPNEDFNEGTDYLKYEICIGPECNEGIIEFALGESDACIVTAKYDKLQKVKGISQIVHDVLANDEFCQSYANVSSLTIAAQPEFGSANVDDGLIFYYPNDDFIGTDFLVYSISSGGDSPETAYAIMEISINENACEFSTTADSFSYTKAEILANQGVFIEQATYLDNDDFCDLAYSTLQVYNLDQPNQGTVQFTFNEGFSFVPDEIVSGIYTFSYQVCDQAQTICSEGTLITIEILEDLSNCDILASNDQYTYDKATFYEEVQNRGFIFYQNTELISNDELCQFTEQELTMSLSTTPFYGSINEITGEGFGYTPGDNFETEDSFTYTLCDPNGYCVEGTVTISIDEREACIIDASNDDFSFTQAEADENISTYGFFVLDFSVIINNDEICQNNWGDLTIEVSSNPTYGTVNYHNLELFSYEPSDQFNGTDSFNYSLCDPNGTCTEGNVTITVQ
ncbi:Ig-like domain-containing protein [Reichenbachiella sp. MSK19-1]|uniref:Ig-like domain-containing protein n=1 Tax=Reichenbachiella sp. MSK19-1 TaxID=1897631 RepID=UPI000E6C0C1D|nr:Ig-like domain-containing protein [Reichenbachiella sp. MSK19-1]RJE74576.1 hypothetical protein BGP76_15645 [Reichenbachiella sp. MSK19-1]